jgi:hypothetical protein
MIIMTLRFYGILISTPLHHEQDEDHWPFSKSQEIENTLNPETCAVPCELEN